MTETLHYSILKKENAIEIRQYPAHILAQVDLEESSYRKAIARGFGPLADFIFGENLPSDKISMTTPVHVSRSQKIAMTSPVTVSGEGRYSVSFVMPEQYTLETLPKPKNPRVRIEKVSARTMAAIRFRGFFNARKVREAKNRLKEWAKSQGLRLIGEFVVAGYDPPWVPWFLAHNEVMVQVGDADKRKIA
jgi:effector-binding domain-containing protein